MTRTSKKGRLVAGLLVAFILGATAAGALSIDWPNAPQAPLNKLQDPGLWTVSDYAAWTPAQKNNFIVGLWTGIYMVKVMLNHPDMDWKHFCTWLDYETGMDTDAVKAEIEAYGARHGRGALLLDALSAEGLSRADR